MTEQLKQRVETILLVLREHPTRGADLLVDFARRFSADPQLEDQAILLKMELSEAGPEAQKAIVEKLEQIAHAVVSHYDPQALAAFNAKETAIAEVLQKRTPANDLVLEARDLKKSYPGSGFTLQLEHLELRLGQITGLVGENATGKTTLFRILAGDLAQDSGELHFPLFDPDHRLSWPALKGKIAYVPQELPAWNGSLEDNLRFEAAIHGIGGAENRKAVNYIVQRLGLGMHLDKTWQQLSGGYKLRFALAKALVWGAKLLILDEPLAFLDVKTQLLVLNDLQNLAKSLQQPIAVLLSSQHLHETEAVADQLLFMREGQVEHLGQRSNWGAGRTQNIFEIGVKLSYPELALHLEAFNHQKLWNNGMNWFVVTPLSVSGQDLLQHLTGRGVGVEYFRDLSHSVKTRFYEDHL
ncbi:MAG: ABC transporter ATP-binding protein [Saprospiraceae bacterium]|nr:ABC transporter ATP-binding protein [Saprospiraceae bacterium]